MRIREGVARMNITAQTVPDGLTLGRAFPLDARFTFQSTWRPVPFVANGSKAACAASRKEVRRA
jgi:hypothetical protein